jgi:hypothetical protein
VAFTLNDCVTKETPVAALGTVILMAASVRRVDKLKVSERLWFRRRAARDPDSRAALCRPSEATAPDNDKASGKFSIQSEFLSVLTVTQLQERCRVGHQELQQCRDGNRRPRWQQQCYRVVSLKRRTKNVSKTPTTSCHGRR